MDVYQAIKSRRTVRDYKPDLIPEDVLRKILQAARWSPSSSNTQKWSFIVIQDREILAKLGEVAKQGTFIGQAPLCIAIVMDDAPRPQLDAGRALQQMELMAWSEGVGMCFVGVRGEGALGYPRAYGADHPAALRLPGRRPQAAGHAPKGHERDHPFRTIRGHGPGAIGPN